MAQEYKSIKFKFNLPYVVRLKYDKGVKKTGEYGDFWVHGVEHEGEDYSFIATMSLNKLLEQYKKGDLVEIMKVDDDGDKSHFEVEDLSEEDIKSTDYKQPPGKIELVPNWDKINVDKQHAITLAIAMKLAVQSLPATKAKFKDYEEIEVRMVKFKAIMEKYLGGVVMKEPEKKFSPLVQKKWDEFDKYLEENKFKIVSYDKVRTWLDNLKDPTTKVLTEQLAKLKDSLDPKTSEYKSYHESLITTCCNTLKTKDRLPVIQTLTNIVKSWKIDGLEKLSGTTENQCIDLLAAFDKQLTDEDSDPLPF